MCDNNSIFPFHSFYPGLFVLLCPAFEIHGFAHVLKSLLFFIRAAYTLRIDAPQRDTGFFFAIFFRGKFRGCGDKSCPDLTRDLLPARPIHAICNLENIYQRRDAKRGAAIHFAFLLGRRVSSNNNRPLARTLSG